MESRSVTPAPSPVLSGENGRPAVDHELGGGSAKRREDPAGAERGGFGFRGGARLPFVPRHQLPAYSPVTLRAVARAARATFGDPSRPVERLAERLRNDFGASEAVLCDSGTSALQLAVRIADRCLPGPNIVALPAFTCFEVAAAAIGAGAHLALYDMDPETLTPDPASLERTLREGAKTLVVCPLFGIPVDWREIRALVRQYRATVIEDAAQGHGGWSGGERLGAHGVLSVLSFGRGKGWSGSGGGALLARDGGGLPLPRSGPGRSRLLEMSEPGFADGAKVVGAALAQWAVGRPQAFSLPSALPWLGLGETVYRDARPPGGIAPASAELLLETRDAALAEARVRERNAAYYAAHLPGEPSIRPIRIHSPEAGPQLSREEDRPGFLRYPVRLTGGFAGFPGAERARRLGIEPGYPSTLCALGPVRSRMWRRGGRWQGAEELAQQLVTLPTHSLTTTEDRRSIVAALEEYARAAR